MGRSIVALSSPIRLAPNQEAVAVCLASGRSMRATATETGVGISTIKDWLHRPHVVQRVRELRAEMTSRVVGMATEGMISAVYRLHELIQSESESIALRACDTMLTHGAAFTALAMMEQRLSALEAGTNG